MMAERSRVNDPPVEISTLPKTGRVTVSVAPPSAAPQTKQAPRSGGFACPAGHTTPTSCGAEVFELLERGVPRCVFSPRAEAGSLPGPGGAAGACCGAADAWGAGPAAGTGCGALAWRGPCGEAP